MATVGTRAGELFFEERGNGSPVVLLHATLHDCHDFDSVLPELAKNYRVIALDWPGHGDSAPLDDGSDLSAPLLADLLEDVIDSLGLEHLSLIGNSVGGFAAARFAATRPEMVDALVLVNPGGFTKMNFASRAFCRAMGTPWVNRAVMPVFIRSYMKAQSESDQRVAKRALARARSAEGSSAAADLWRSFADPRHDLTGIAGAITAPTLIVHGSKDTAIPARDARLAADLISESRLESLPTGHVPFSSQPEEFLSLVEPFLRRATESPR